MGRWPLSSQLRRQAILQYNTIQCHCGHDPLTLVYSESKETSKLIRYIEAELFSCLFVIIRSWLEEIRDDEG